METTRDFNNKLLKRRELIFKLPSESNPGFEKTKQVIATEFKANPESIAIKSLESNFGTNEFIVEAFVYESKEQMDKIEPKPKAKKGASA